MNYNRDPNSKTVFIVGVGRSGTSLLQSMLHAHQDVVFLPETHFFRHYIARPYTRWGHQRGGVKLFRSMLASDEEYQRADIPEEELLAPFLKGTQSFNLSLVYARLLRLYREREQVSLIGEKDPRLIDYLPQLRYVFPEARILHIVRDPRDVLLSRMNADWSAGRPDWLHVMTYRAQIVRGRHQGRRSFGARYMEVRYEELLAEPERVLRNVAMHVGFAYSDEMLAFQQSAGELVHESERAWKIETMGPLLRDNIGKWQNGLTDWQVQLTEHVCSEAFDWFGYERAEDTMELSRAQCTALQLAPIVGAGFEYLYALACRFR